jgi:oxalate decarboxylase
MERDAKLSGALRLALGFLLALTAGWVDAVGFIEIGQLYLSFMSGNTTQLGLAIASANDIRILRSGGVIASFFLGAFAGTLLADATGRYRLPVVLAAEFTLICATIALTTMQPGFAALLPITIAMGMQNALRQPIGRADVGKTFVTGALFSSGQSLARALTGVAPRTEWLAFLATWIAFVLGAAGGAYALQRSSLLTNLYALAALLAFLALLTTPARGSAADHAIEG